MRVTSLVEMAGVGAAGFTLYDLYRAAKAARENAACEHSKFAVGAAIVLRSGLMYAGCNVENPAYGSTMCAERVAIFWARSDNGTLASGDIQAVMVVTDTGNNPAPPCGACRGVIATFDTEDTLVYASNLDGSVVHEFRMGELLPYSFERGHGQQLLALKA